jgi:membrane protease YdiL (CAAX protease family)
MLPDPIETPPIEPAPEIPAVLAGGAVREPFWGYADLALVIGYGFIGLLLLVFALAVLVIFYPRLRTDQTPLILPATLASYGVIYLSLRIVFGMRYGKPVFTSLGWRRVNFNPVLAGIGGIALAFLVNFVAFLLHTPKVSSPLDKLTDSPLMLAMFGIIAVTIAPLFEELFFRGFLQPLLSRSLGMASGIVLTALLFAAPHGPQYSWAWQYIAAIFLVGVVLGVVRARTNSIIPTTIIHGCYNGAFVIALAVSKYKGS